MIYSDTGKSVCSNYTMIAFLIIASSGNIRRNTTEKDQRRARS